MQSIAIIVVVGSFVICCWCCCCCPVYPIFGSQWNLVIDVDIIYNLTFCNFDHTEHDDFETLPSTGLTHANDEILSLIDDDCEDFDRF